MKEPSQKSSQHKSSAVEQRASAGPDGALMPPPVSSNCIPAEATEQVPGASMPVQMKVGLSAGGSDAGSAPRNRTGLPDALKTGIEALSNMSLDDVRVHTNSPRPAQLNALAYAQGTDIHVAPGQERHLPHEAWHVVQQKQGRVKPTLQMKQGIQVNDNKGLEHEADVMGGKALVNTAHHIHVKPHRGQPLFRMQRSSIPDLTAPIQRKLWTCYGPDLWYSADWEETKQPTGLPATHASGRAWQATDTYDDGVVAGAAAAVAVAPAPVARDDEKKGITGILKQGALISGIETARGMLKGSVPGTPKAVAGKDIRADLKALLAPGADLAGAKRRQYVRLDQQGNAEGHTGYQIQVGGSDFKPTQTSDTSLSCIQVKNGVIFSIPTYRTAHLESVNTGCVITVTDGKE